MVLYWQLYEISTGIPFPNKEYRRSAVQLLAKSAKPERTCSKALRSGPTGCKALPPREVSTDNTNHCDESISSNFKKLCCVYEEWEDSVHKM